MEHFEEKLQQNKSTVASLKSKYSAMGNIRFVAFLVMAAGFIVGISDSKPGWTILGVLGLVLFIGFIFAHGKVSEELEYAKAMSVVYERYIKRFSDEWKSFPIDGSAYLTDEDLVAKDMDIMGANSLYQFLCVAGTERGRRKLASTLRDLAFSTEDIVKRQTAIKELCEKEDFAMNMECLSVKSAKTRKKKITVDEFLEYVVSDVHMPAAFNVLRFLFPAVTVALLVAGYAGVISLGWTLVSFFAILMFSWCTGGVAEAAVMPMVAFGYVIEDYISMFEAVASEAFESPLLNDIKASISHETGALTAIKSLNKINNAFNIRYNPVAHQLLSGLILWDFHLGFMMDAWRAENGTKLAGWIDAISSMEELLSLTVLARTRQVTYPTVTANASVKAVGTGLRHPLIAPDKVVANDVDFAGGTTIITGSNMSGKTTFLRTLGTNLVLAYAGAPVLAESLTADYMKIFTSMRVTDDVSGGISTFYAEILRIKTMVEYKKKCQPMLCLVDEIFKGTNSADRIVGATQVIKKLSDDYAMTVVSTHDFELCDIKNEKNEPAANYHFEEYYEGDQLRFDYKKKDGRCTTTNAMAILHMAGLD